MATVLRLLSLLVAAVLVLAAGAATAQAQRDIAAGVRRDLRRPSVEENIAVATVLGSTEAPTEAELNDGVILGLAAALAAATPQAQAAAAVAAAAPAAASTGLGPILCNTLDCPTYKVLERYDGTELRRYDPASFSSTVLSLDDVGSIEKAAILGFHRLLKYNLGDNEDGQKVAMTAPVLYGLDVDRKKSSRRDIRFLDRFSVSFFVPFKYQDEPPSPSSPDVFLVDVKEVDIFVRSFDGYATGARIHRVASSFLRDLYDEGHRVDCRTVYIAQYSPPFQPVFRYNEVWFLRRRRRHTTEQDSTAAAGDAAVDESCDFLAAVGGDQNAQPSDQQQSKQALEQEIFQAVADVVSEARRDGLFVDPVAMEA